MEASDRQSKAALDASIEASRNDQRAWVGVTSFALPECPNGNRSVFISPGCMGRLGVNIDNTGKSVATEFQNRARAVLAGTTNYFSVRDQIGQVSDLSSAVLFPGQMVTTYITSTWSIPSPQRNLTISGRDVRPCMSSGSSTIATLPDDRIRQLIVLILTANLGPFPIVALATRPTSKKHKLEAASLSRRALSHQSQVN
jgi:hypothetical protein